MKTTISTFVTPEVLVKLSNINIDVKKKTFSLTLGTKTTRQRNFREEQVEGTITSSLYHWLTRMTDVKVPVQQGEEIVYIPTGAKATPFQKYLVKRGVEFKPGVLSSMVFQCNNTSDSYQDCPFRLVMLNGKNTLTKVNVPSKKKTESVDPSTGEIKTTYSIKRGTVQGKTIKAFVHPTKYRRLVVQQTQEVEVVSQEEANNFFAKKLAQQQA